jgi:hypothetical protein
MSVNAGKENERKWAEYWNCLRSKNQYLPVKPSGEVNIAQVGRDSKIGRENLYKNQNIYPKLLKAIEETVQAQKDPGVAVPLNPEQRRADVSQKQIELHLRQINRLEEKVSVQAVEILELRQRVKTLEAEKARFEIIEDLVIETGRRIVPY